jgi:hypothetical protein
MAFERLRTIVITAIPKPRSREIFRKVAETTRLPENVRFLSGLPRKSQSTIDGQFR